MKQDDKGYKENYRWRNAHHNISFIADRYYEVWNRNAQDMLSNDALQRWHDGITNLKGILRQAEADHKRVRALGSGWSLSKVQVCKHYLVNTKPLDSAFIGLPQNYLASSTPNANCYVLAQCGVSIAQLNRWLFNNHLALSTSGASDGQTIVGAMSTGTHGGAMQFGSIPDYIYGIHLLTSADEHYWIEAGQKVLSEEAVTKFCGANVTRFNNDDMFNACLVSFGSFGIITSVLLKAEPLYRLKLYQGYYSYDQVQPCLNNPNNLESLGLENNPHHFELVLNPYKQKEVITRIMYKETALREAFAPEVSYSLGVDLVELFGEIADSIPLSVAAILGHLEPFLKKKFGEVNGVLTYPGNAFTGGYSGFRGKGFSVDLGVDVSNTEWALAILYDTVKQHPLPGIFGVRYVKKSKALLPVAKFDLTCTFEIQASYSNTSLNFYKALWDALDDSGITYSFHWGQMNNLNADKVRQKWSDDTVNKWLKARRSFLKTKQQREMFSNKFLHDCNLDN